MNCLIFYKNLLKVNKNLNKFSDKLNHSLNEIEVQNKFSNLSEISVINCKTVENYNNYCYKEYVDKQESFENVLPKCESSSKSRPHLDENNYCIQLNKNQFVCDFNECKKSFKTKSGLKRHQTSHSTERPFKCDINGCDKSFKTSSHLSVHKRCVHSINRYRCDWKGCNKIFGTKNILCEHKRIHSGENPFECDINGCGKRFRNKSGLKEHQDGFHLNSRFECDWKDCMKIFLSKRGLNFHKKSIHLNERNFVCDWSEFWDPKELMKQFF